MWGQPELSPAQVIFLAFRLGRHKRGRALLGVLEAADVSDLFRALVPVGRIEAVRQEYLVFKTAAGDYLVFSPSSRGSSSYHMTKVTAEKVEALAKVVGKGHTTGSLMKEKKLEGAFGSGDRTAMRFDILIGLYVLTAMGKVKMERSGRNLVFTKKG